MSPSPIKPANYNEPAEPVTYHQLEMRRRELAVGEEKPEPDVSQLPPQPSGSPWASDPVPPEEPIDGRVDGDTMGIEIDQLNR
jgi:hypothetical protein